MEQGRDWVGHCRILVWLSTVLSMVLGLAGLAVGVWNDLHSSAFGGDVVCVGQK